MSQTIRVLIVEDHMLVSMYLEDALSDLGYQVVVAASLNEAIDCARTIEIDVCLLDLNLSGQITYPVADILQERKIPFIWNTGYSADMVQSRFRDKIIITKPYQIKDIKNAIEKVLSNRNDISKTIMQYDLSDE